MVPKDIFDFFDLLPTSKATTMDKIRFLFSVYDGDNDGFWVEEDFYAFLYELGTQESYESQFSDCFKFINKSMSGKIAYEELYVNLPSLCEMDYLPPTPNGMLRTRIKPRNSPHYNIYVKQLLNDDSDFLSTPLMNINESPIVEAKKKAQIKSSDKPKEHHDAVAKPSGKPAAADSKSSKTPERKQSIKRKPSKSSKTPDKSTNNSQPEEAYTANAHKSANVEPATDIHDKPPATAAQAKDSHDSKTHSLERRVSNGKQSKLTKKRQSSISKKDKRSVEEEKPSHTKEEHKGKREESSTVNTESIHDHSKDEPLPKIPTHKVAPMPITKPVHYDSKQAAAMVSVLPEFKALSRKLSEKKTVQKAPSSGAKSKVMHKRETTSSSHGGESPEPVRTVPLLDTFVREKSFNPKAETSASVIDRRPTSMFRDGLERRNSGNKGKMPHIHDESVASDSHEPTVISHKREDSDKSSLRRNSSIFREPPKNDGDESDTDGGKKMQHRNSKTSADIHDTPPPPPPPPRRIEVPKDIRHNFKLATSLYGASAKRKSSLSKKLKKKSSMKAAQPSNSGTNSRYHSDSDNESTTSSRARASNSRSNKIAPAQEVATGIDKLNLPKLAPIKSEYILETLAITDKIDDMSPSPSTLNRLPSIKRKNSQRKNAEQTDSEHMAPHPPPHQEPRNVEVPRTTKALIRLASTVYSSPPLKKKRSIKKK